jgi:hypothetical protein
MFLASLTLADDTDFRTPSKTSKYFLELPSGETYVSFIELFSKGKYSTSFIEINSDKTKNYLISNSPIFSTVLNGYAYNFANFSYGIFDIKDNVIPYLDKTFLQKIFFIFHKIGFRPRITDAMRTTTNQTKYKRRGWSNMDISPHLVGLAVDLVIYSASDREIIKKLSELLGLKFLYHGGGGNRHIHLQDEMHWSEIQKSDIRLISDSLNVFLKSLSGKEEIQEIDSRKKEGQNFTYNFVTEKHGGIIFNIEDIYGEKAADINTGIFEPGNYAIKINLDYLEKGFYKVNIYEREKFIVQKYFVKY